MRHNISNGFKNVDLNLWLLLKKLWANFYFFETLTASHLTPGIRINCIQIRQVTPHKKPRKKGRVPACKVIAEKKSLWTIKSWIKRY